MKSFKWLFLSTVTMFVLIFGLYSFNRKDQNRGIRLPAYARWSEEVKLAYQFALSNPLVLNKIPCYCGCYRLNHQSVENCFIKDFKKSGAPIFDSHGAYCGICYSIVLDAKQLFEQGKNILEIRQFINNKYSKYGRGTNTPL